MPRRRFIASLLGVLLWTGACGDSEPPAPEPVVDAPPPVAAEPRVGLWVLAEGSERVLEHPERVDALLADAASLGATDLFVQVYRGGRAWFDSSLADAEPWRVAFEAQGRDPLAHLIERAHAQGLRVHAWVNVLSLAGNRNAPILTDLGREVAMVDRRGRSILDFPGLDVPPPERATVRMGTPAVWLDPAAPGVADRLVDTFAELMVRHPDLDGIHLDYIRYPDVLPFSPGSRFRVGVDFGYGEASRQKFEAETGLRAPSARVDGDGDAWDTWRRSQVTQLVERIGDALYAVNPQGELSAAVSAYPERAYLSLFQNWRGWLDDEHLDFAVTMLYTRDDALLRQEATGYTGGLGGDRVWIGLGSWLFARDPARAVAQRETVTALEPAGVALFSWDSIAAAPPLREALGVERDGDD